MVLENNLTFAKFVNREYDKTFKGFGGAKIGTTLNVRKPVRFIGRTGQAINLENLVETQVPVTLTTQFGVDFEVTSTQMTLQIDEFSDRFIKPAVAKIANQIDSDGLSLASTAIYNAVGTPGTTPSTLQTYLSAGALLDKTATPRDGQRSVVINPDGQATIVGALSGLFNDTTEVSKQYKTGTMGLTGGLKWSMDQNVANHTVGPLGGTPAVNGANQTGASLITNGWTAAAALRLNQGDIFTIAGVFGVNPQSYQSTGSLQQFVVTANVNSDGTGAATIPISPAIVTSGSGQTVTASPASGALLTVLGAANTVTPQNIAFHKDAFTLACADLDLPKAGIIEGARYSDDQLGMSIRYISAYDVTNDLWISRFDVLYGWAVLRPELACRIQG